MTVSLKNLQVLVLDCQTTGSYPGKGHLLEIGWAAVRAGHARDRSEQTVSAHLVALPDQATIPRYVTRLTGISDDDLKQKIPRPAKIWDELVHAAGKVAAAGRASSCPTVIHFARFEEPFLRHFHQQHSPDTPFPFDIICSHEIARRLLPDLPRRGLRAIAGYFGHSVPQQKRCSAHAVATAIIWHHLVKLLAQTCAIHSLDELRVWLKNTPVPAAIKRRYPMPRDIRLALPDQPGIYRLLRSNGDVLYIGKAGSLKRRVNSYFQKSRQHSENTLEMLTQAADLQITPTGSALEAALLESEEIKRQCPPYNIALQQWDRQLWFCNRDFSQFSHAVDQHHRLGPVPSRKEFAALNAIGKYLQQGPSEYPDFAQLTAADFLGIPPEYAPQTQCLLEGLNIFRQTHAGLEQSGNLWRSLLTIGTQLWREKMKEAVPVNDSGESDTAEPDKDSKTFGSESWTPESVVKGIESLLRRCAHWLRRSRWFCVLSESCLAWNSGNHRDDMKIVLVFAGGGVVDRYRAQTQMPLPRPPGAGVPFGDRQRNLNLITYDRLRVATTELRRLLAENRSVRLRIGKRALLKEKELSGALKWL
jgi:DNA polymerase-3 subunit epsilon